MGPLKGIHADVFNYCWIKRLVGPIIVSVQVLAYLPRGARVPDRYLGRAFSESSMLLLALPLSNQLLFFFSFIYYYYYYYYF